MTQLTKPKRYDSKTPNWQRVTIWIVAIVMTLGTILTFFVMVFAGQNSDIDPNTIAAKREQEAYQEYLESDEYKEYLKQQDEAKANLRALDGFADKVTAFNASEITTLTVETLVEGGGATVKENATLTVNYTGWTPDGTIFDSTKSEGSDASPASLTLSKSKIIEGWLVGLTDRRAGGVYLLSIPSNLAYGEAGSGDTIPPNTPLRFLVQITDVTNP